MAKSTKKLSKKTTNDNISKEYVEELEDQLLQLRIENNMMTDKNYREISDKVYRVDSGEYESLIEGQIIGNKYKIPALEDNQNGEMQVMEVAPINSVVEVDTRRIVIA